MICVQYKYLGDELTQGYVIGTGAIDVSRDGFFVDIKAVSTFGTVMFCHFPNGWQWPRDRKIIDIWQD